MGQSYESTLKEILAENIITLPDTRGFESKIKLSWWNDAHYCDFHRCKGHLTRSCIQMKHKIKDLVDEEIIEIEGPQSNTDHGVFKNPLPNYEKGESSTPNGKDKNVNHIHDMFILHLSKVEYPHNNVEIHDEKNTITTNKKVNNAQPKDGQNLTSNETHINNTIKIPSRLAHDVDHQITPSKSKEKTNNHLSMLQ